MSLSDRARFFRQYLSKPGTVGAIAPSSRALASALCEPFRRADDPARVLEVGAGTGVITRHIGRLLGEEDELDICEIGEEFADILQREVLSCPALSPAVAGGRVRLLRMPVQELTDANRYDFVISGLPLTAFEFDDVRIVLDTIRRCLKPGGVFSYFEYIGMRRVSWLFSVGRKRRRIRRVSKYLSEHIRTHQVARRTVLQNLPPAHARHFRFEPA